MQRFIRKFRKRFRKFIQATVYTTELNNFPQLSAIKISFEISFIFLNVELLNNCVINQSLGY